MIGHSIETEGVVMHVMVSEIGGPMRIRIIRGGDVSPLMKLTGAQVDELIDALTELLVCVTEDDGEDAAGEESR